MLLSLIWHNNIEYNMDIDMRDTHKFWGYIEEKQYKTVMNNGDSLNINLNTISQKDLDITEIRLYNICNVGSNPKIGKFYITVNGRPALPTIGIQPNSLPVYVAFPPCNDYGTTQTFIFDTDDSRGSGKFNYNLKYYGDTIKIKTIELYIVKSD
jgi:hypothetical protein